MVWVLLVMASFTNVFRIWILMLCGLGFAAFPTRLVPLQSPGLHILEKMGILIAISIVPSQILILYDTFADYQFNTFADCLLFLADTVDAANMIYCVILCRKAEIMLSKLAVSFDNCRHLLRLFNKKTTATAIIVLLCAWACLQSGIVVSLIVTTDLPVCQDAITAKGEKWYARMAVCLSGPVWHMAIISRRLYHTLVLFTTAALGFVARAIIEEISSATRESLTGALKKYLALRQDIKELDKYLSGFSFMFTYQDVCYILLSAYPVGQKFADGHKLDIMQFLTMVNGAVRLAATSLFFLYLQEGMRAILPAIRSFNSETRRAPHVKKIVKSVTKFPAALTLGGVTVTRVLLFSLAFGIFMSTITFSELGQDSVGRTSGADDYIKLFGMVGGNFSILARH